MDRSALREAVLNAIIHNDYIGGAYPVFEIYDDRIEVISSGGLPIGLSEKKNSLKEDLFRVIKN